MYYSNQKIIKNKVGLLNLAEELGNVSKACKVMGLSRDTFYRYKSAVDEVTEQAVSKFAIEFPAYGQLRASNELCKQGVKVFLFLQVVCGVFGCAIILVL
jgi:molybdenum-dependent DNA-binding transcriptional regulator ModE